MPGPARTRVDVRGAGVVSFRGRGGRVCAPGAVRPGQGPGGAYARVRRYVCSAGGPPCATRQVPVVTPPARGQGLPFALLPVRVCRAAASTTSRSPAREWSGEFKLMISVGRLVTARSASGPPRTSLGLVFLTR